MKSNGMSIVSLGVMLVSPVCVVSRFLVVPLSMPMWEVMVSYVDRLPNGRASWFMYGSCDGRTFLFCM